MPHDPALRTYVLRQGDRALILAQRLLEVITHAPEIEEDLALANLALDLIGQARTVYSSIDDEDVLAYQREPHEFLNPLLVEQPNVDFAHVIGRQFLHDAFALPYWTAMQSSRHEVLSALAAKAVKETAYHLRHSSTWVIRLGDGTDESRTRMQAAIDALWPFTGELFECDEVESTLIEGDVAADPAPLQLAWHETVTSTFQSATLSVPDDVAMHTGGRDGRHGESFAALIAEMQVVARAHPGASW